MAEASFDREATDRFGEAQEVSIETRLDASSPVHSAVIWTVVVGGGVFVRSVRGEKGRWYREVSANPRATLRLDDRRVPVRAVPESDAATIQDVSEAYRAKYADSYPGPTAGMVREEVLPTTLRLLPA